MMGIPNSSRIEFSVDREQFGSRFSVYGRVKSEAGHLFYVEPLIFTALPKGSVCNPFATINSSAAQNLMDELWRSGIRPTEGSGSAGSLAATERHLDDMRAIAFKGVGIKSL